MSNFVKKQSFDVDYAPTHITSWTSSRTGLRLTYIDQASPVVNGYFAVATECPDDSGAPHTLEHLVFMGSERYPYKGLLDTLGNRFFLMTNAWTAVDQTVYTLTTAGWEGFKTLLPIYLDHLFHPTLTDEACLTEVYHIDGKGKERGVVFSEMQGIETQSWFISLLNLQRTLYRKESGYSSETGGLMSELRKLTNDQIRQFHKDMYRPDNCCVVITGSVDETELLQVMDEFDLILPAREPGVISKRPFVDSPRDYPPKENIVKTVEFPETDESMGEVFISWIGPEAKDDVANVAVDLIGSYFTDSAISLFNKTLVEVENPMATDVDYSTDDYVYTGINFSLNGVPTEQLQQVDVVLKDLIQSQTKPENIDLKYLQQVIRQQRLKYVSTAEKSPLTFSNVAISDFIYGDDTTLKAWTQNLDTYDELLEWDTVKWAQVIDKWFASNPSVTILGKPSPALHESLKRQNKKILKDIKAKYGKDGLAELDEKLNLAKEHNDKPIPEDLLTQFGKPDPSKINFIETESYSGGSNQLAGYVQEDEFSKLLSKNADFPMFFHFEHFKSQFSTINIVMSSGKVSPPLLRYLSVLEEIFSLPLALPDGTYIPYEDVISQINEDLIEFHLDNGYQGQFLELIDIKLKFESTKYTNAIDWLLKVMQYSVFDEKRVKIIIEKIINSIPDKKRNEELMMYSAQYRTLYSEKSVRRAQDSLNTEQFYKDCLEQINQGNFKKIQDDLNLLKLQLFDLSNFKVFVVGECKNLEGPITSWKPFVESFAKGKYTPQPFEELPRSFEYRSEIGVKCSKYAHLVTTPATDTTHLIASTKIGNDYLDEDITKIALASEFLTAVEGPFWRGIRGTGLSYGANIQRNLETGYLNFSIYRGSDGQESWKVAKKIVEDYCDGTLKFDKISMENSIAAIVNELANSESNSFDAANNKIVDNLFKHRGPAYAKSFLKKLDKITEEDLVYIVNKYFKPLFSAETSVIFSCIPPAKVSAFKEFLTEQGYSVTVEEINAEIGDDDEETGSEGEYTSDEESGSEDDSEESGSEDDSEETGSEDESEDED